MTLPPGPYMTHAEYQAVMASLEWTWRCADRGERRDPNFRIVQMLGAKLPLLFLRREGQ